MNKNLFLSKETTISFEEKNVSKLYLYYEGTELCLAIDNYDINAIYKIMQDSELYVPIKQLFRQLKSAAGMRYFATSRLGSKFEWVSEGYGMPEVQNRLVIQEHGNMYTLRFIKNKYNLVDDKKICSVHFDLMNSKNQAVSQLFNEMFVNLYNKKKYTDSKKLTMK